MDFADPDAVPLFEWGPASHPLDLPGVVYIDGLPCSRACQSYMAWSDRALSARHREERETSVAAPAEAETERLEPAARPRVARQPAPVSRSAPRAGIAASNAKVLNQGVAHQEGRRAQFRASSNQEGNSGGHCDSD